MPTTASTSTSTTAPTDDAASRARKLRDTESSAVLLEEPLPSPEPFTAPAASAAAPPTAASTAAASKSLSRGPELVDNPFVNTFFNINCILANGTGNPCDVDVAASFTDELFGTLRVEYSITLIASLVALFSYAHLGGIPRPTDAWGTFFWAAWMVLLSCQYATVALSLAMHVVAFLGVHSRLSPCLVASGGVKLLNAFMSATFFANPVVLSRLVLLFLYAHLLSLGGLVWGGRDVRSKQEFVAEAMRMCKPEEKVFRQRIPFASAHYAAARWILYGIAFSAPLAGSGASDALGGPTFVLCVAWAAAAAFAFGTPLLSGIMSAAGLPNDAFLAIALGVPLIAASIASTRLYAAFLPLGLLVFVVVQQFYRGGERLLVHARDDNTLKGAGPQWVGTNGKPMRLQGRALPARLHRLAGTTRMAVGWLGSLFPFSSASGALARPASEYLSFSENSFATLAGGLACFWGALALAPTVIYAGWAATEGTAPMVDPPVAEWEATARLATGLLGTAGFCFVVGWMPLGIIASLLKMERTGKACKALRERLYGTDEYTSRRLLLTASAALGAMVYLWVLPTATFHTLAAAYANSFRSFGTGRFQWATLMPPLGHILSGLADPLALARRAIALTSGMANYSAFSPSYFAEGVAVLNALNVLLGTLKLLATYGCKVLALVDALKGLLGLTASKDGEDGTVLLRECMTDPSAVFEVAVGKSDGSSSAAAVAEKAGLTVEELLGRAAVELSGKGIKEQDATPLATVIEQNGKLSTLNLSSNQLGGAFAGMLATAVAKSRSLEAIDLSDNALGAEGGKAFAEAIAVSTSLTEVTLLKNEFDVKTAKTLSQVSREKQVSLCGIAIDQAEASFKGLGLRTADVVLIAAAVEFRSSLTSINLDGNEIGNEGCKAFGKVLASSRNIKTVNLTNNKISEEGAKHIADAVAASRSLSVVDMRFNPIAGAGAIRLSAAIVRNTGILKFNEIPIKEMRADGFSELNLNKVGIGVDGCMVVAGLLPVMGSLEKLNLGYNGLCGVKYGEGTYAGEGMVALAEALARVASYALLTQADLRGNYLDTKAKQLLRECVAAQEDFVLNM